MYVDETLAFIKYVNDDVPFPNTILSDMSVLELLHEVEKSSVS